MLIILPAYNEGNNLANMLPQLIERYNVLVIDDGSTDNTASVAKAMGANVIIHPTNKGLGRSLYDGFVWAAKNNEDVIITMDADNTMDTSLIPQMADLVKNGFDLVIASRYQKGAVVENVPAYRKVMSITASYICRAAFKLPVNDYSSGYRAYSGKAVKKAIKHYGWGFITSSGFDCQIEILRKLKPFITNACEIPIRLDYAPKAGHSSFNFGKTLKGYSKQLVYAVKERFRKSQSAQSRKVSHLSANASTKGGKNAV
jgi:dolichol-phosphate mannosyltransferase